MVAPVIVIAGAMAGSAILNYVLNDRVASAQERYAGYSSDFIRRSAQENKQYWSDYYRNTGFRPRYPMRTGAEYNLSGLYANRISQTSAQVSRYRALANVGTSGAYLLGSVYQKPGYNYVSPYASYDYSYR